MNNFRINYLAQSIFSQSSRAIKVAGQLTQLRLFQNQSNQVATFVSRDIQIYETMGNKMI